MAVFETIANHIDKILIFHFLGAAAVAVYGIAQFPVQHLKGMLGKIYEVIFPKLAACDFKALQALLPRRVFFVFLAVAMLFVGYVLIAPLLFSWLFPAYMASVFMSQIIAGVLFAIPLRMYTQALIAHQKKRQLYSVRIGGSVFKLLLLALLLPPFGVWGAIATLILAEFFTGFTAFILFRRAR